MNQELGEYTCPICDSNLSQVKSSYLRQQHVEKCITSMNKPTSKEPELDYNECVFCGKNLSHFKYNQKQVHINSCLDKEVEKEEEIKEFAGQPVSFLSTLEICPVCHEVTPFLEQSLNQKLKHTKKCAKDNKLTLLQLLQKLQWIGWGHLLIPTTTNTTNTIIPPQPIPSTISHQLKSTYIHNNNSIYDDDGDDDFSTNVVIHKVATTNNNKRSRIEDKNDEELQLVLSLSKSMNPEQQQIAKKKKVGITRSNERDWNAANIWSIEESRKQVILNLDEMLFPDNNEHEIFKQAEREKSIGYLNESKLKLLNNTSNYYWNLTSNKDNNWDTLFIFQTAFLHQMYMK